MKRAFTFLTLLIFAGNAYSQTPNWLWAIGGTNSGYGYTSGLTIDNSGNLYLAGRAGAGPLSFGGKTISTSGTIPFVEKLDSAANGIWLSANYPFSSFSYTYALGVDGQDNSFITGNDGSGNAVYIQRFTGSGNLAWSVMAPNTNCEGAGITADNLGNVYSAGNYSGTTISFGSTTLPAGSSSYSGYLVKQDTSGNFIWATYFTSTSGSYVAGKHVVTDRQGNVYVCGGYQGTATFYSAKGGTTITTPASVATGNFSDLFIAKYDSSGTVLWVTTAANAGLAYSSYYYGNVLTIDSCDNLYVGGIFQNTAQFGNIPVTSSGSNDVFVGKYNTLARRWEWVQSGGSAGADYLQAITLDKNSDIYATGEYANTPATFGTTTLSTGNTFVAKYANSNGALQWVQSATCSGVTGIAVNKQKQVYISGGFASSGAVFGPSTLGGVTNGLFIAMLDTVSQRSIVPVLQPAYCPGTTSNIPYTITGTFNAGNVFTAQLSDSTGSFASPTNIGSANSIYSGGISIAIPSNTSTGSNYLIRIVSSNPATSSYASGCGAYGYANNFYVSIGNAIVTVSNDTTVCASSIIRLHASGGTSYSWSSGGLLFDSNSADPSAEPFTSQTYTVTATSACGSITKTVAVTVVSLTITPVTHLLCYGQSVTLTVSGGTGITWSPSIGLNTTSGNSVIATPLTLIVYTATASGGCAGSAMDTIDVIHPSPLTFTPAAPRVCPGQIVALVASGGSHLSWSPSIGLNKASGDTVIASLPLSVDSIVYTVTGYGLSGCPDTGFVTLFSGGSSLGGVIAALQDTICYGTRGQLALSGNSNNSIQWQSSTDGINFTNLPGDTLSTLTTNSLKQSTWFIAIIGSGNCSATSDSLLLYVPPQPLAIITASDSATTVTFNADVYSGDIRSYFWDFGDGQSASIPDPIHTYDSAGIYRVCLSITSVDGCQSDECTNVIVNAANKCLAYFGLYPDNSNPHHWFILNQSKGDAPINYNWSWGDGNTSTGQTPSHTYDSAGSYTICLNITDDTLCTSNLCDSALSLFRLEGNTQIFVDVVTSLSSGIVSVAGNQQVIVYPNPFSEQLTVSSKQGAVSNKIQSIEMYDVLGRVVLDKELGNTTNTSLQLDVSSLAKGMYYVMIRTVNADYVQKVVKQ